MRRVLVSLVCSVMIVLCLSSVTLAQGEPVPPESAPVEGGVPGPTGDFTLSGSADIAGEPTMTGDESTLTLQALPGIGVQAEPEAFWRLGTTGEGAVPVEALQGRLFGPAGAFRSDRGATDLYYVFPAPGEPWTIEAAYFCLLERTGSYPGSAQLTLEALDANGLPLRVVSGPEVDLTSAALATWTPLALSSFAVDKTVFPNELLAFHLHLSGGSGGNLDLRPAFEVQLSEGGGSGATHLRRRDHHQAREPGAGAAR